MSNEKIRHVRACVALMLCASMVFGMFLVGTGHGLAAPEQATFKGNVKIGTEPAPGTLVMYSLDVQRSPTGNSTVSNSTGDYEIWVEGGNDYYLYFANGDAMFDSNSQIQSHIGVSQTKYVNATLTPAPARTVTVKGFLTNASNASEPVTGGHVLALRASMGGEPDYINWTKPNATGYYEAMVLPGIVMAAVFDAPGYFPAMGPSSLVTAVPGDSIWVNLSLVPFTGYTVNVTGYVMNSGSPAPIHDATVTASLDDIGVSESNQTDMSGYYLVRIIDGDGELQASAPGYVSQRQDNVHFSGNISYDFYLNKETAEIHGWVTDGLTGLPIADARVSVGDNIGSYLDQYNYTRTDSEGYYSMNISEGDWNVNAEAVGYGDDYDMVTVLSGEDMLCNLTLQPESGVIKGFVKDGATGLPIADATVVISGSYGSNRTWTNSSGYYEINCLPDEYEMTFMATGYMWEVTMGSAMTVVANETLWHNHSLDPATVHLFGTVKDAVTGDPITGASITAAGYSRTDPAFVRMVSTSSVDGNYSMMVAYDTSFTIIMGDAWPDYEEVQWMVTIPDVLEFEFNITMLPTSGAPEYWLEGYVTDSVSGTPIESAYVTASYGTSTLVSVSTNASGYYNMTLPTVEMTVGASASGHVPAEIVVPAPSPNSTVVQDFALDPHNEAPVMLNMSVDPKSNISTHNHANMSVEIVEPYMQMVQLVLGKVTEVIGDTAWVNPQDGYNSMMMYGAFWGELDWRELAPDHFLLYLPDWDTTSEDVVLLEDGNGVWEMSNSYSTGFDGSHSVWGGYTNASMMFTMWGRAVFDPTGDFIGFDNGGGLIPGTEIDVTGEFWMEADLLQFNLTTGSIMSMMAGETEHLQAVTMQFHATPITYPSGVYAAIFVASDVAENTNFTVSLFEVDNDPPAADAGPDQSEIVNLQVTLDASASTDNVGIVNYTWTIEDGTDVILYGAVVTYAFTTPGNHTVTVTVTDAAGNSGSDTAVIEALADQAPVAVAGADQVVDEDSVVDFDGTGSHDDIGVTNYTWTVVGTATVMYGATPSCTFATPGTYHVQLVVTDTIGQLSVYDEVLVAVSDITDPVANAGPDQIVNIGTQATFDGTGSSDNGAVTEYTWTFIDGVLRTLTGATPSYTFTVDGDYVVTLTVSDAEDNTATDTMVVHVNVAPEADAGPDVDASAGEEVTFDGSGSSDDEELVNYTWTFTYQGTERSIYGAAPVFTFEEAGTYEVQLTVRDVGGLADTDTVTVTVGGAGASTFLTDYWWVLALVVVVIIVAAVLLMRRGKGGAPAKAAEVEETPPPPDDTGELQFPPPSDEEL